MSAADVIFGKPAQTSYASTAATRPPGYSFAQNFFNSLQGISKNPFPVFSGKLDPGLSPTLTDLIQRAQGYAASSPPSILQGASGVYGRLMAPHLQNPVTRIFGGSPEMTGRINPNQRVFGGGTAGSMTFPGSQTGTLPLMMAMGGSSFQPPSQMGGGSGPGPAPVQSMNGGGYQPIQSPQVSQPGGWNGGSLAPAPSMSPFNDQNYGGLANAMGGGSVRSNPAFSDPGLMDQINQVQNNLRRQVSNPSPPSGGGMPPGLLNLLSYLTQGQGQQAQGA